MLQVYKSTSLPRTCPDHGLLAICLHANGASVIAGDRAAGPLGVARENFRLYLRQTQEELSSAIAAQKEDEAPRLQSRSSGLLDADADVRGRPDQGTVVSEGMGEEELVVAADIPRLECRLGDGLAVLEEGEVDTVCIAGVGASCVYSQVLLSVGAFARAYNSYGVQLRICCLSF